MAGPAAIAVPVVIIALAALMGGGKGKVDPKVQAAYEAGFTKGKSDKENGSVELLNPSADIYGATNNAITAAYNKGYKDGYAAGVKKTTGGGGGKTVGDVIDTKPPTVSVADIELAASVGSIDGYQKGKADAQAGRSPNPYSYTYSKGAPSNSTLREAYQIAFRSNYADGYEEGKKLVATSGYGSDVATGGWPRESMKRDGYPRYWYNM